ncbi:MAG: M50 family metallopeptidase [Planctomycetota bacterium]
MESEDKAPNSNAASSPEAPVDSNFRMRLALLLLFSFPTAYVGVLLAVIFHEVLGHGLSAVLLGGEFVGFSIHWDGMGTATTRTTGATETQEVLYLGAGILVTTFVAIALLTYPFRNEARLFLRLTLALLAISFVMDGSPYLLWSSLSPEFAVGDPARILEIIDSPWLRWWFVAAGVVLTVAGTFWSMSLFFRTAETWLGCGQPLSRRRRRIALVVLLIAPAVLSESLFDWNQLVPGIELLPSYFSVGVLVSISLWLDWRPRSVLPVELPLSASYGPLAAAWTSALALVLVVVLWLSDGVTWY